MARHIFQLKVHVARFHFAIPAERRNSTSSPPFPSRSGTWPPSVHAMPRHLLLPCAETCLTVEASAVAIGTVDTINGFEHFRPPVTAKWAEHVIGPPLFGFSNSVPMEKTLAGGPMFGVQSHCQRPCTLRKGAAREMKLFACCSSHQCV